MVVPNEAQIVHIYHFAPEHLPGLPISHLPGNDVFSLTVFCLDYTCIDPYFNVDDYDTIECDDICDNDQCCELGRE